MVFVEALTYKTMGTASYQDICVHIFKLAYNKAIEDVLELELLMPDEVEQLIISD